MSPWDNFRYCRKALNLSAINIACSIYQSPSAVESDRILSKHRRLAAPRQHKGDDHARLRSARAIASLQPFFRQGDAKRVKESPQGGTYRRSRSSRNPGLLRVAN